MSLATGIAVKTGQQAAEERITQRLGHATSGRQIRVVPLPQSNRIRLTELTSSTNVVLSEIDLHYVKADISQVLPPVIPYRGQWPASQALICRYLLETYGLYFEEGDFNTPMELEFDDSYKDNHDIVRLVIGPASVRWKQWGVLALRISQTE